MRISDVYEGLGKATSQAGFGGHALFSNEISSVNDGVSCSLWMNQRKYFLKEKQLLTLQTKKRLKKEPRLAVIRPKNMKKGGKRNHLPVVVRSTREKMTGSGVSGLYEIAEGYGITSCVTFFLPRGVQVYFLLFSFISRCVKEWFVAQ